MVKLTACEGVGGVVFDCDGVLADTTGCWDDAFAGAAREFGFALSREQLGGLRGAALSTAAQRLMRWSARPLRHDELIRALRERLVQAIDAAELVLADGVRQLLDELYGVVSLGVASNSPRAVLSRVLARLGITEYFTAAISADDVPYPKPAPDPYLEACETLRVEPRLSFAIEDSEIGLQSARAAGLTAIELTTSRARKSDRTLRVRSLADPRITKLVLASAVSFREETS